jgi:hypothetical protein
MTMAIAVSFILGVGVGAVLGFILPSGTRFWMGRREWREAARELELADRLLETLGEVDEPHQAFEEGEVGRGSMAGGPAPRPGWARRP